MIAGALWAAIAGWLKAATGAHEVITTIMLNFIAFRLTDYLLRNPPIQKEGRTDPISESVLASAQLPKLLAWLDPSLRIHAGFIIALVAVVVVYWLLFRSTVGFEFRASGANPDAARYAGMRSGWIIVLVMACAGALAGLAGRQPGARRARPRLAQLLRRHRLRRDRGRAARALAPVRRAPRRHPVRRAPGRRPADAGRGRRLASTSSPSSRR